ncbi:hypothetical protein RJ640_006801 [Escallonia rubra]|uniref:RRM domain-containing protein n=1 Tax=Escallonia rubra TaxID=112253 RepID=A0AA88UU41_9ASTE|nr:hypothetical protein RJ640_006801 [Escallonia rubra]
MATSCITPPNPSPLLCKTRTRTTIAKPFLFSSSLPSSIHFASHPRVSSSLLCSHNTASTKYKKKNWLSTVFALVENDQLAVPIPTTTAAAPEGDNGEDEDSRFNNSTKPCQVYLCNLPRSSGISELNDLFKPFGTVQSVEVSRNAETGVSRGCGYVTMSSIAEAKAAISALDGSDVGGREMRVMFSDDMGIGRGNLEELNSKPKKNLIFESPFKVYVGNLAWSVKPEGLRNLFTQFGTVVSARVLHDRKGGKNRVYGFLSFSTAAELEAAMSLNGVVQSMFPTFNLHMFLLHMTAVQQGNNDEYSQMQGEKEKKVHPIAGLHMPKKLAELHEVPEDS